MPGTASSTSGQLQTCADSDQIVCCVSSEVSPWASSNKAVVPSMLMTGSCAMLLIPASIGLFQPAFEKVDIDPAGDELRITHKGPMQRQIGFDAVDHHFIQR
jgi:hypothetical protein